MNTPRLSHLAPRLRIAVVGGGASGIAAAHVLQRKHDVTLFEASDVLGGHAHSVPVDDGAGGHVEVDTAFLIYNELYYPRFVSLIHELGVANCTAPAEMSASFVDHDAGLCYALGRGIDALFAQRRNAVRPSFHRMFLDLALFRRRAYNDLTRGSIAEHVTLGEYLAPYSAPFRDNLVVPLATAIWSVPGQRVLSHPAQSILQFFMNHGLLKGHSGDAWRTFIGGSVQYVRAFRRHFVGRLELGRPVTKVLRSAAGVRLIVGGQVEPFDKVVLATHADRALAVLDAPSPGEAALLGAWRYHANVVTLHSDPTSVMHLDRRLWSSWNVVTRRGRSAVTYYLNRVQKLRARHDYFVTLGDAPPIDAHFTVARFSYRHPIFDRASVAAQRDLHALNGHANTFYCGSYMGHGFHEDAVASGFEAARCLDASPPAASSRSPWSRRLERSPFDYL